MEPIKRLPRPYVEFDAISYWEGIQRDELVMQRCAQCKQYRWFPRPQCHQCGSFAQEWVKMSGRAKLLSWTIVVYPVHPATVDEVPYNIARVALNEDPAALQLITNVVDCKPDDLRFDMPLEVTIRPMKGWETEGVKLPYFRRA
jgi:uncharacterized OB-fold protein